MLQTMAENWWMILLRGIFAIIFGTLALAFPGLTLVALIYVFAAYALIDGGITVYQAFSSRKTDTNWGWGIAEGIIGIIAGIGAALVPGLAGLTLLFVMAFWAIVTGALEIYAAIRLRKRLEGEIWLGLAGLLSVIFGIIVIFNPLGGALATAWLIGIYAIVFGASMIALALRLRSIHNESDSDSTSSSDMIGNPA